MSTVRLIEHRITQELLRRRERAAPVGTRKMAERIITAAAVTASLLLLGSYLQELLWALLGGAVVLTLGTRTT